MVRDGILAPQSLDVGLLGASERDIPFECQPILRRQVVLQHINRKELPVESISVPTAARKHLRGVRPRRHADQNAFLRPPCRLNAMDSQIRVELSIDTSAVSRRARWRSCESWCASIRSSRPPRIDHDDFLGPINDRLRHDLGFRRADHGSNEVLLLGDVLQIDGREHRDARFEQFLDILIALWAATAGWIVVGETVNETHLRMARQHGRDVDHGHATEILRRNHVKRADDLRQVPRQLGLCGRDDDIFAPFMAAAAFVEQLEGLPDAGRVAETRTSSCPRCWPARRPRSVGAVLPDRV